MRLLEEGVNIEELTKKDIEDMAQHYVRHIDDYLPNTYKKLLNTFIKDLKNAIKARHRRLVVISADDPAVHGVLGAALLLRVDKYVRRHVAGKEINILYMFHDEFKDAKLRKEIIKRAIKSRAVVSKITIARYEESDRYLGTTFQGLVLDLYNDLKPNDVGRLVDVVEGGGVIVFLIPPWEKWDTWMTIFKRNLLVPGYKTTRHIFIKWFKMKLKQHKGIYIYDAVDDDIIHMKPIKESAYTRPEIRIPDETIFPRELYELALTQDQVKVIKTIEELVEVPKKKRKAIVITADRGRGKSCAVGIAVIGLIKVFMKQKRKVRVLLTAPSPTSVQSFFALAQKAAEAVGLDASTVERGGKIIELYSDRFSIEYWSPLEATKIRGDIVVVDEAAGVYVPLLHKIWKRHRRLIFATTIHGYEGAGRGFSVRFLSAIRSDPRTELIEVEMHEPIRYAPNDPIEEWLFNALLLNAEPAELDKDDLKAIEEGKLEYLKLDPNWLFSPEGEETLRQLFGIYVIAHYRNEPDDLGILADAPHHLIRAVRVPSGKIVCAAQIAREGALDDDTIDELLRGEKIPGNIIPDRMLKHFRVREFGRLVGWRIVRIATHPKVQGKGIGSFMLKNVYEEAKSLQRLDWVGSGFGVNEKLLNFWLKNGFLPVHMSPDRNPVSGEYTILVLNPISDIMKRLTELANREFKRKLIESLHDTYHDLETEVAIMIMKAGEPVKVYEDRRPPLSEIQVDRLWIYAYGPMTYEAMCDVMHDYARFYWYSYPKTGGLHLSWKEEYLLTAKALQGKPWGKIAEELNTKPYNLMVLMKRIARRVLEHYYGKDERSPVGLEATDLFKEHGGEEPREAQPEPQNSEQ